MMFAASVFRGLFFGWCIVGTAAAADWPAWRGPQANSVVPAGNYPVEFSSTKNVAWKIDLPGPGSSTPVAWGDAIFVTCEIGDQEALCCYNLAGEEQWRRTFGTRVPGKHRNATGANPSPVTDGQRVFVYFKSGRLIALSTTGDELWRRELQDEYAENTLWWDLGASPVLTPAGVLITVIQDDDSYLATFDRATGETLWKQPRAVPSPSESAQSYTTPTLVDTPSGPMIVVWGADHLTGHNPQTGEEIFRCGGFNPQQEGNWRTIASATTTNGIAIVPFGRGEFLSAVRLDGRGDVTDTHREWTLAGVGSDVPCPVLHDGKAYLLGDKGEIGCVDIASGKRLWTASLPRSRQRYYSSPLLAGDVLYCLREDGLICAARLTGDGIELLAESKLDENLIAPPTPLGDNGLLVRTRERLYLFRKP